ncbi:zinc-ribbon domain-containing protein [Dysgonomonas sp. GY75]|uniref:zinc ribbon domain-containing protein n=1 Tax=Dysgonomonas sp. GY75 TaxID=2780419 RepID=UPI0018831FA3|nr:zinc ribbon domain-containing protein [Dysgonomonas sp. GY75]MBF0647517.1 zinc-ribbon domain-containing protein [Dysgonomonas sp. GY75]
MAIKKCSNCGAILKEEAVRCRYCGEEFSNSSSADTKGVNRSDTRDVIYEEFGDSKPKLLRQNFTMAKIVSIALFFFIISFFVLVGILKDLKGSDSSVIIFLPIIAIAGFSTWILFILRQYLDNFQQYNNLQTNLKWLGISISGIFGLFIVYLPLAYYIDKLSLGGIAALLYIGAVVLIIILNILSGWRLARFDGDYVGGINLLGYAMLAMTIFPIVLPVLPLLLFYIFYKAANYAHWYGFDDQ